MKRINYDKNNKKQVHSLWYHVMRLSVLDISIIICIIMSFFVSVDIDSIVTITDKIFSYCWLVFSLYIITMELKQVIVKMLKDISDCQADYNMLIHSGLSDLYAVETLREEYAYSKSTINGIKRIEVIV